VERTSSSFRSTAFAPRTRTTMRVFKEAYRRRLVDAMALRLTPVRTERRQKIPILHLAQTGGPKDRAVARRLAVACKRNSNVVSQAAVGETVSAREPAVFEATQKYDINSSQIQTAILPRLATWRPAFDSEASRPPPRVAR